jgi:hypothetical protein
MSGVSRLVAVPKPVREPVVDTHVVVVHILRDWVRQVPSRFDVAES